MNINATNDCENKQRFGVVELDILLFYKIKKA